MAQFAGVHRLPPIDYTARTHDTAHDRAFNALLDKSDKLPEGKLVGFMMRFPAMDNYAWYIVTKMRPFTIKLVDHWDGYEIPAAHVRGLTLADAKEQQRSRLAFAALVASRK